VADPDDVSPLVSCQVGHGFSERRWAGPEASRIGRQTIKVRLKPDKDTAQLNEQLRAAEQPDSGLIRTLMMHDQNDPTRVYTLVVFESEEKARAREQDPRRREALQAVRAMMADVFDGPPDFTDLTVAEEWTGYAGEPQRDGVKR
jgi:quinol monooxygenase YgiN